MIEISVSKNVNSKEMVALYNEMGWMTGDENKREDLAKKIVKN